MSRARVPRVLALIREVPVAESCVGFALCRYLRIVGSGSFARTFVVSVLLPCYYPYLPWHDSLAVCRSNSFELPPLLLPFSISLPFRTSSHPGYRDLPSPSPNFSTLVLIPSSNSIFLPTSTWLLTDMFHPELPHHHNLPQPSPTLQSHEENPAVKTVAPGVVPWSATTASLLALSMDLKRVRRDVESTISPPRP